MQKTKQEIHKSDALIIDMTDKSTGRAIEAGIAYALGILKRLKCRLDPRLKSLLAL